MQRTSHHACEDERIELYLLVINLGRDTCNNHRKSFKFSFRDGLMDSDFTEEVSLSCHRRLISISNATFEPWDVEYDFLGDIATCAISE